MGGPFQRELRAAKMSYSSEPRNDEWNSDRPSEERKYDGPAGMDPDGVIDSNWEEVCENFDDMNLKEELLRGIYAYGFEKPSAIQQRAIVPCIKGMDVIAQAQSGTGKTATFSIAILEKIDTGLRECQALLLAPTRELAQQIQKVVMSLGDYMGAQCHARRHGPEGEGRDHEGVQVRLLSCPHHHRPAGQRYRRPAGLLGHQLRPPHQQRKLHPQNR